MKKDRLDELLGHAFSEKDEARDVGRAGLQRFRRGISSGVEGTAILDSLLSRALATPDVELPSPTSDAGLRRLRERLAARPTRRPSPVLAPALAMATVAVVILALVIVQPFSSVKPGEGPSVGGSNGGIFADALKTRNDIIAKLPGRLSEPAVIHFPLDGGSTDGRMVNRKADALDAFSTKVRGESIARRIGGNRRIILAFLTNGGGYSVSEERSSTQSDPLAQTLSRQEILLNEKLNRVAEGF